MKKNFSGGRLFQWGNLVDLLFGKGGEANGVNLNRLLFGLGQRFGDLFSQAEMPVLMSEVFKALKLVKSEGE